MYDFTVVAPEISRLNDAQRQEYNTLRGRVARAQENVARLTNALRTHTVRSGDSLSKIALDTYGSGNRWPDIRDANAYLEDPENPFVGMVLVIP